MEYRYHHWTERTREIGEFLKSRLGSSPKQLSTGPDLRVGEVTVEVKATNEWQRTGHANGSRRRGRFCLHGYESADYICFVLVGRRATIARKGSMKFHLAPFASVVERFGSVATINHKYVFAE